MSHIRNSSPKNYNFVIISPYWGTIPLTINPQNKPDNLISRHEQQLQSQTEMNQYLVKIKPQGFNSIILSYGNSTSASYLVVSSQHR